MSAIPGDLGWGGGFRAFFRRLALGSTGLAVLGGIGVLAVSGAVDLGIDADRPPFREISLISEAQAFQITVPATTIGPGESGTILPETSIESSVQRIVVIEDGGTLYNLGTINSGGRSAAIRGQDDATVIAEGGRFQSEGSAIWIEGYASVALSAGAEVHSGGNAIDLDGGGTVVVSGGSKVSSVRSAALFGRKYRDVVILGESSISGGSGTGTAVRFNEGDDRLYVYLGEATIAGELDGGSGDGDLLAFGSRFDATYDGDFSFAVRRFEHRGFFADGADATLTIDTDSSLTSASTILHPFFAGAAGLVINRDDVSVVGESAFTVASGASLDNSGSLYVEDAHGVRIAEGGAFTHRNAIRATGAPAAGVHGEGSATVSLIGGSIAAADEGIEVSGFGLIDLRSGASIDAGGDGVHIRGGGSAAVTGGSSIHAGSDGVYIVEGGSAAVTGGASIHAGDDGVYIGEGGSAAVTGGAAIHAGGEGVHIRESGSLAVTGGASIHAGSDAVYITGDGTVVISGSTLDADGEGVYIGDEGSLAFTDGASIRAGDVGVYISDGGDGFVLISGSTLEARNEGIYIQNSGTLEMSGGASIHAEGDGFRVNEDGAAVISGSTLNADDDAVFIRDNGSLAVTGGSSIRAGDAAVYIEGEGTILVSASTLEAGDVGVYIGSGGSAAVIGGASIHAGDEAVFIDDESAILVSASTLEGGTDGVRISYGGVVHVVGGTISALGGVAIRGDSSPDIVVLKGGSLYGASGTAAALGGGDDRLDAYLGAAAAALHGIVDAGSGSDVLGVGAHSDATYGGEALSFSHRNFGIHGFFAEGSDTTLTLERGAAAASTKILAPSIGATGLIRNRDDISLVDENAFTIMEGAFLDNEGSLHVANADGVRIASGGGRFSNDGTIVAGGVAVRGGAGDDVVALNGGSLYGASGAAVSLGAGDDRLDAYLGAAAAGVHGSVDGGSGSDLLGLGARSDATYGGEALSFSHTNFERRGFFAEGADTTLTLERGNAAASAKILAPSGGAAGRVRNRDDVSLVDESAFTIEAGAFLDNEGNLNVANADGVRIESGGGGFSNGGTIAAGGVAVRGGSGDDVVTLNGGSLYGGSGTAVSMGAGDDSLSLYLDAPGDDGTAAYNGILDGGAGEDVFNLTSRGDASHSGFAIHGFESHIFAAEEETATLTIETSAPLTATSRILAPSGGALGLVDNRSDVSVVGESAFTIARGEIVALGAARTAQRQAVARSDASASLFFQNYLLRVGRLDNSGSLYVADAPGVIIDDVSEFVHRGEISVTGAGADADGIVVGNVGTAFVSGGRIFASDAAVELRGSGYAGFSFALAHISNGATLAGDVAVRGGKGVNYVELGAASLYGASGTAVALGDGNGDLALDIAALARGDLVYDGILDGGGGHDVLAMGSSRNATYDGSPLPSDIVNFEEFSRLYASGETTTLTIDTPSSLTSGYIIVSVLGGPGMVRNLDDASVVNESAFTLTNDMRLHNEGDLRAVNASGVRVLGGGTFMHGGAIVADRRGVDADDDVLVSLHEGASIYAGDDGLRAGFDGTVAMAGATLRAGNDGVFISHLGSIGLSGGVSLDAGNHGLRVGNGGAIALSEATVRAGGDGVMVAGSGRVGISEGSSIRSEGGAGVHLVGGDLTLSGSRAEGSIGVFVGAGDAMLDGSTLIGAMAAFSGGDGANAVVFRSSSLYGASGTAAALGGGDDRLDVYLDAGALAIGGILDGGSGEDVLAVGADSNATFGGGASFAVRNFENQAFFADGADATLTIDTSSSLTSGSTIVAPLRGAVGFARSGAGFARGAVAPARNGAVGLVDNRDDVSVVGESAFTIMAGASLDNSGSLHVVGAPGVIVEDEGILIHRGVIRAIGASSDGVSGEDDATVSVIGGVIVADDQGIETDDDGFVSLVQGASIDAGGDGLRLYGDGSVAMSGSTLRAIDDGVYIGYDGSVGLSGGASLDVGGDGLLIEGDGTVMMSGSTLRAGGDGVYVRDDGSVGLSGGASLNVGGDGVFIDDDGTVAISGSTLRAGGDGVYVSDDGSVGLSGGASLDVGGDGVYVRGNGTIMMSAATLRADGDGVYVRGDGTVMMSAATIRADGDGVKLAGADVAASAVGSSIFSANGDAVSLDGAGAVVVSDSTLSAKYRGILVLDAASVSVNGSSIYVDETEGYGAVRIIDVGTVALSGSTLETGGDGVYLYDGGSIALEGSSIRAADDALRLDGPGSIVVAGSTLEAGGDGVYISDGGAVALSGSTIGAGDAGVRSGGVGTVAIRDGSSIHSENGAGVHLVGGDLTLSGATLEGSIGAFIGAGDATATGSTLIGVAAALSGGDEANAVELRSSSLYAASGTAVALGGGNDRLNIYIDGDEETMIAGDLDGGAGADVLAVGTGSDATFGGDIPFAVHSFENQGFFAEGANTTLTLAAGLSLRSSSTIVAPMSGTVGLVDNRGRASVIDDSAFTIMEGAFLDNSGSLYAIASSAGAAAAVVEIDRFGVFTHRGTIAARGGAGSPAGVQGADFSTIEAIGGLIDSDGDGVRLTGQSGSLFMGAGAHVVAGEAGVRAAENVDLVFSQSMVVSQNADGVVLDDGAIDVSSASSVRGLDDGVSIVDSGFVVVSSGATVHGVFGDAIAIDSGDVMISASTLRAGDDGVFIADFGSVGVVSGASIYALDSALRIGVEGTIAVADASLEAEDGHAIHIGIRGDSDFGDGSISLVGARVVAGGFSADGVRIDGDGTIAASDSLIFANMSGLHIDGTGSILAGPGAMIVSASGDAVRLLEGTIVVSGATLSGDRGGVAIEVSGEIAVDDGSSIHAGSGDALSLFAGDLRLSGSTLRAGDDGIDIDDDGTVMISGSTLRTDDDGIDIFGTGTVAISDSTLEAGDDGVYIVGAGAVVISRTTIGAEDEAVDLDDGGTLIVSGSTLEAADNGVDVFGYGSIALSESSLRAATDGIRLNGGGEAVVSNSSLSADRDGATIFGTGAASIEDSSIYAGRNVVVMGDGTAMISGSTLNTPNDGIVVYDGGAASLSGTTLEAGRNAIALISGDLTLSGSRVRGSIGAYLGDGDAIVTGSTLIGSTLAFYGGDGANAVEFRNASLYAASGTAVHLGGGNDRLDLYIDVDGKSIIVGDIDGGEGEDVLAVGARSNAIYRGGVSFAVRNFEDHGFLAEGANTTLTIDTDSSLTASSTILTPLSGAVGLVDNRDDVFIVDASAFTVASGARLDNSGSLYVVNAHGVIVEDEGVLIHRGTIRAIGASSDGVSGEDDATVSVIGGVIVADDQGIETDDDGFVSLVQGASIDAGGDGLRIYGDGTVTASGATLEAVDDGVYIGVDGAVALSGTTIRAGGDGLLIDGDGTVAISASTLRAGGDGVYIGYDGSIGLSGGASLDVGGDGVYIGGDGTVMMSGATLDVGDNGVRIADDGTITLSGSTLRAGGDGVHIGGDAAASVRGSSIFSANGDAVSLGGAGAVVVSDSTLSAKYRGILVLAAASVSVSGSSIYVDETEGYGAVRIIDVGTVALSGSTLETGGDGVYLYDGGSVSLDDSSIRAAEDALRLDGAGSIVVAGSTLEAVGDGVYVSDDGTVMMSGSTIRAGGDGVYLYGGGSVSLSGASIAAADGAVRVGESGSIVVAGSTLEAVGDGVYVSDDGTVMMSGSTIRAGGDGVYLYGGGSVSLSGASIAAADDAVRVGESGSIVVAGSTLEAGNRGVHLSGGGTVMMTGALLRATVDGVLLGSGEAVIANSSLETGRDGVAISAAGATRIENSSLHTGGDAVVLGAGTATIEDSTLNVLLQSTLLGASADGIRIVGAGAATVRRSSISVSDGDAVSLGSGEAVVSRSTLQAGFGGYGVYMSGVGSAAAIGSSIDAEAGALHIDSHGTIVVSDSALQAGGDGVNISGFASVAAIGSSIGSGSDAVNVEGSGSVVVSGSTLQASRKGVEIHGEGVLEVSDGALIRALDAVVIESGRAAISGSKLDAGRHGVAVDVDGALSLLAGSSVAAETGHAVSFGGDGSVVIADATLTAGGAGVTIAGAGVLRMRDNAAIDAVSDAVRIAGGGDVIVAGGVLVGGAVAIALGDDDDDVQLTHASLYGASGTAVALGGGNDMFMRGEGVVIDGTIDAGAGTMDRYLDLAAAIPVPTDATGSSVAAADLFSATVAALAAPATAIGFDSVEGRYASDFTGDIMQTGDLNLVERNIDFLDLNGSSYAMTESAAEGRPTLTVNGMFLGGGVFAGVGTIVAAADGDFVIRGPGMLSPGMSVGEMRFNLPPGTNKLVLKDHQYEAEIDINPINRSARTAEADRIVVENGALEFDDYRIRLVFINDPDPNGGTQNPARLTALAIDTPYTATIASAAAGISGDFTTLRPLYNNNSLTSTLQTTLNIVGNDLVAEFKRVAGVNESISSEAYISAPIAFMRIHTESIEDSLDRKRRASEIISETGLTAWSDAHVSRHRRKGENRLHRRGYGIDAYGALVGLEAHVEDSFAVGIFTGYMGGEYKARDGLEAKHDYNAVVMGGSAHYTLDDTRLFVQIAYGLGDVEADRTHQGDRVTADYDLRIMSVGGGVELTKIRVGPVEVTPMVGVDYLNYRRARINEEGEPNVFDFTLPEDHYEEVQISGGIDFEFEPPQLLGSDIHYRLSGALEGSGAVASSDTDQQRGRSGYDGVKPYDSALSYAIGFESGFADRVSGYILYQGETDFGDYSAHGGKMGVSLGF